MRVMTAFASTFATIGLMGYAPVAHAETASYLSIDRNRDQACASAMAKARSAYGGKAHTSDISACSCTLRAQTGLWVCTAQFEYKPREVRHYKIKPN